MRILHDSDLKVTHYKLKLQRDIRWIENVISMLRIVNVHVGGV